MLWGGPAADRPTRRPPRFGSTKGGGGVPPTPLRRGVGVPPPPLQPPKLSNTPRGHTLAGASPRGGSVELPPLNIKGFQFPAGPQKEGPGDGARNDTTAGAGQPKRVDGA